MRQITELQRSRGCRVILTRPLCFISRPNWKSPVRLQHKRQPMLDPGLCTTLVNVEVFKACWPTWPYSKNAKANAKVCDGAHVLLDTICTHQSSPHMVQPMISHMFFLETEERCWNGPAEWLKVFSFISTRACHVLRPVVLNNVIGDKSVPECVSIPLTTSDFHVRMNSSEPCAAVIGLQHTTASWCLDGDRRLFVKSVCVSNPNSGCCSKTLKITPRAYSVLGALCNVMVWAYNAGICSTFWIVNQQSFDDCPREFGWFEVMQEASETTWWQ